VYKIKDRVGVAYVAAEGQGVFALRLAAAKMAADVKDVIPFAWCRSVPPLMTREGVEAFIDRLRGVDKLMQERFGVRLGAVFIDTVAACFDMKDENSNAEVARICNIIRSIGDAVGAVMIPIHHYGKDAATGLRGGSAWRGAADVVISVTADIDPVTGEVRNRGIAVAKARDGEQGPVAPFILEWVKLGEDEDGEVFGTCVVRRDTERVLGPGSKVPKGLQALEIACRTAVGKNGEDVQLQNDGARIRAVELKHVKAIFCEVYVTGEGDPKKAIAARDRAWRRALQKLPQNYGAGPGRDGREWLWLKLPSAQSDYTDTRGGRTRRTSP
jgi:hypothetical protein